MSHIQEAISRYNKILEAPAHKDLSWVKLLHEQMEAERLSAGGRLLCPFLRPNFVTRRQYESMVKTGEALISAIERMEQVVLRLTRTPGADATFASRENAGQRRSGLSHVGSRGAI